MPIAVRSPVTAAGRPTGTFQRPEYGDARRSFEPPATKSRASLVALVVVAAAVGGLVLTPPPRVHAAPAPEVEYVYDVVARRHYGFPNNDALAYGYGICDKVRRGEGYGQVMGDVKGDVTPSDEFAANYLVSYAVSLLCPDLIWQLRNSAAGYQPPGGAPPFSTYY